MATARYVARLEANAAPRRVEVEEAGDGHYWVRVDDTEHRIDARPLDHGAVSLIVDGQSFSVEFEEKGDDVAVLVRDQIFLIDVADERRLRMRGAASRFTLEGNQTIAAPMPGRVVKVMVKVGDAIAEGQPLVVVEAMKMENELRSPKAGKVVEIRTSEGQAVEGGAALVVVG
jgi:biotin carboxyl carrier protein